MRSFHTFSEIPVNALMHTISDDEGNILLSEAKSPVSTYR